MVHACGHLIKDEKVSTIIYLFAMDFAQNHKFLKILKPQDETKIIYEGIKKR